MISIERQIEKILDNRMDTFKYNTKKFLVAKEQVEDLLKNVCISVANKNGLTTSAAV